MFLTLSQPFQNFEQISFRSASNTTSVWSEPWRSPSSFQAWNCHRHGRLRCGNLAQGTWCRGEQFQYETRV